MRIRGLQEVIIKFKADRDLAENLIDALYEKYGDFDYYEIDGRYTMKKVLPVIVEHFTGDDVDTPYTHIDSDVDVKDIENFIRRWDDEMGLMDLSVKEEIGEEA